MGYADELPVNVETPEPCLGDYPEDPWSGPLIKKICTDEFGEWGAPDGDGVCCYWIVYHERTISHPTTQEYQTNVTEIFWEGEDCEKRSRGDIVHRFQEWLYKSKPDEFFANHIGPPLGNNWTGSSTMSFYTTGGCYQKDVEGNTILNEDGEPIPCNSSEYCCRYDKQVNFINGEVTSIDSILSENSDPLIYVNKDTIPVHIVCPSSCNSGCDNVLMEHLVDLTCDLPCNTTSWGEELQFEDVPIPGCPGCYMTVIFRKRSTPPCPEYGMETLNDIYFDRLQYYWEPGQPCHLCTASDQTIHNAAMEYLLNNAFDNLPGNGECKTSYRIIQSACWHDHYTDGIPGILPPQRMLIKCTANNCCVKQYKFCKTEGGILLTPELISTTSTSESCNFNPYPCIFVCEPPDEE